jgi:hypothetical protein
LLARHRCAPARSPCLDVVSSHALRVFSAALSPDQLSRREWCGLRESNTLLRSGAPLLNQSTKPAQRMSRKSVKRFSEKDMRKATRATDAHPCVKNAKWLSLGDSNTRPRSPQPRALPAELRDKVRCASRKDPRELVRVAGFDPAASCARGRRSARLSYTLKLARRAGNDPASPVRQTGRFT